MVKGMKMYQIALLVAGLASFATEVRADYLDGLAAMVKGDYKTACAEFGALADQGDAKAQIKIGEMHFRGQCGPQNDTEAAKWYQKAAEQGSSEAQVYLGVVYSKGKGVPQSDAEAVSWFRKAAEQGNVLGQRLLGGMYAAGRGVAQDYMQAYMWLSLAFEKGNAEAAGDRARFSGKMTTEQVTEAKRLAAEWRPVKTKMKK